MNKRKSAGTIIVWENKVLLFHRDNSPTIPDPDCWSLPGGHVESGETPLEGARRELEEEVSYAPRVLNFLFKVIRKEKDSYIYCAFVDDNEAKLFKHGIGEGQEIGFFTIDEAFKLKLTPILKNYLTKFGKEIKEAMKTGVIPKINL